MGAFDATKSGELPPESRRLSSWKQIARHLGRDRRTVMRWEKRLGLPVHRVPGSSRGSAVYAFTHELDAWLAAGHSATANGDDDEAPSRPRAWLPFSLGVAATSVLVLALVATRTLRGTGQDAPINRVEATANLVAAYNADDNTAWSYAHPAGARFHPEGQDGHIVDVDGDGRPDVIFAANTHTANNAAMVQGELFALSQDGRPWWHAVAHDTLGFGGETFFGPWVSATVEVLPIQGAPRVLWAVHHHTWWPSMAFLFRPDGSVAGRFVNSGWILTVSSVHAERGDLILAGGINNDRGGAMLAVLDPSTLDGASPAWADGAFTCTSCDGGLPLEYLVFPPSHVNQASALPYNETVSIELTETGFKAVVREGPLGSDVHWVYEFSRDLELLRAAPSDSYWPRHRILRLDGYIDHDEENCPEREQRTVLRWTPENGWGDMPVPVG